MIELFIDCVPRALDLFLEFCQLVFEPIGEGASFFREARDFVAVIKWVSVGFCDTFCNVGICRIKNYLMSEGNLVAWPEQIFSLHCQDNT